MIKQKIKMYILLFFFSLQLNKFNHKENHLWINKKCQWLMCYRHPMRRKAYNFIFLVLEAFIFNLGNFVFLFLNVRMMDDGGRIIKNK